MAIIQKPIPLRGSKGEKEVLALLIPVLPIPLSGLNWLKNSALLKDYRTQWSWAKMIDIKP